MSGAGADVIASIEALEAIYSGVSQASVVKEVAALTPAYRAIVEASPFLAIASAGPEGLDCSPRGDLHELVRIVDDRTLLLPDRRGNNRIDTLRNLVRDPRIALLFLVPGSNTTLRINGRARILTTPDLLESFAVEGKTPRTVIEVAIERVYFQCARAVIRAGLWEQATQMRAASVPTPGAILAEITTGDFDGASYDAEWPERAKRSMW